MHKFSEYILYLFIIRAVRQRVLKCAQFVCLFCFFVLFLGGSTSGLMLIGWRAANNIYVINVIWRKTAMETKDCRTNYIRFILKLRCALGSKYTF